MHEGGGILQLDKYWGFYHSQLSNAISAQVGWLWTKHHILLGPRCYFTSDLPIVELSPCSKDGQGEGEAAVIAHQPVSKGIKPGTTESVDREESPEPPAPQFLLRFHQ